MGILASAADERIQDVVVTDETLTFILEDKRHISVPLFWYPKLFDANDKQRSEWRHCCGRYGIHWPYINEDLSSLGLLVGKPAPKVSKST